MQKGPLPKDVHRQHSERVRAGQAKARAKGKVFGRPQLYSDELIAEAIGCHERGDTWAAIAEALGISLKRLYPRVRKLRSAAQHD